MPTNKSANDASALGAVLSSSRPAEEADAEHGRQLTEAALHVKRAVESADFRPPMLPEVAVRLTALAARADADIVAVEKTVASDPAVAAQVLSRASSALASRGITIQSLRVALTRLGLAEVRDIAFQMVARTRLFKVAEFTERMRELLEAAQAAGQLARETCRLIHVEPDLAFMCGLLHDIGEAIVLSLIADATRRNGVSFPAELRAELVTRYHAAIGARVCEVWKLPPAIVDAVGSHHHPERSTHPSQMAKVVAVADRLLEHIGLGIPQRPVTPMGEPLFYQLNLRPDEVTQLIAMAERLKGEKDGKGR